MKGRHLNILVIVIFCVLLAAPLLNKFIKFLPDYPNLENRTLKKSPKLDINYLDPFPALYEAHYNDHFVFRNRLLKFYNIFKLQVFNESAFPESVIVGNDKWLFSAGKEIDDYRGKDNLSADELNQFKLELEYRKAWLDSLGIKFLFVIAPCKANIYSEHVPFSIHKTSKLGWGEQLIAYLNANSSVKPLDLFSYLRRKKGSHQVYSKLDTHWNNWGAYYAADTILEELQKHAVPGLQSCPPYQISQKKVSSNGNCAQILGNPTFFADTEYVLKSEAQFSGPSKVEEFEFIRAGKQLPYLLIGGDSFSISMLPFIAEGFGRSKFIWKYDHLYEEIKREKPDVLLLMIYEPLLRDLLLKQARPGATNTKVG